MGYCWADTVGLEHWGLKRSEGIAQVPWGNIGAESQAHHDNDLIQLVELACGLLKFLDYITS